MSRRSKLDHSAAQCANPATVPTFSTDRLTPTHRRYNDDMGRAPSIATPDPSRTVSLSFFFWGLLPLLLLVAVIDLVTMSPERRIRLLKRSGLSQRAIADRLGISRYRVRLALA
jgi:hypothetical protein